MAIVSSKDISPALRLVTISERLDLQSTEKIEQSFLALTRTGQQNVVVDLADVPFLSSVGIRMLIASSKALKETATEFKGDEQINQAAVRVALEKRFDVDSIDFPGLDSVKIAREGENWVMTSNYEDTVKLFKNISLLVQFDKRAVIE